MYTLTSNSMLICKTCIVQIYQTKCRYVKWRSRLLSFVVYGQDFLSFKGDHLGIMVYWNWRGVGWVLRKRTVHVLISFSFQMVIVNVCCFKLINWEIIMSNILMNFRIKYSNHVGEIPVLWWGWLENSFYWSHDHDIYTLILSGLFSIALKKLSGKAREIDGIVPYIRNH